MTDIVLLPNSSKTSELLAFVFIPFFSILLPQLYWQFAAFIVCSWVSKFIEICATRPTSGKIMWSKHCLSLYSSLEKNLGTYLLIKFSFCQVLWIFTLYMGITGYFANYSTRSTVDFAIGYFLYSIGILLTLRSDSILYEMAHQSVLSTVKVLEGLSLDMDNPRELLQLNYLMKDIERTKPLSGNGLFQIDRSCLTGMVSVAVTYIIILVQFKLSL